MVHKFFINLQNIIIYFGNPEYSASLPPTSHLHFYLSPPNFVFLQKGKEATIIDVGLQQKLSDILHVHHHFVTWPRIFIVFLNYMHKQMIFFWKPIVFIPVITAVLCVFPSLCLCRIFTKITFVADALSAIIFTITATLFFEDDLIAAWLC